MSHWPGRLLNPVIPLDASKTTFPSHRKDTQLVMSQLVSGATTTLHFATGSTRSSERKEAYAGSEILIANRMFMCGLVDMPSTRTTKIWTSERPSLKLHAFLSRAQALLSIILKRLRCYENTNCYGALELLNCPSKTAKLNHSEKSPSQKYWILKVFHQWIPSQVPCYKW